MARNKIHLEGKYVYLDEVEPKYFPYIINWRNNPENNRFLNQPFQLTMEKEMAWYEGYLRDDTQGLLILVAKDGDVPFGTLGWTDYIPEERILIAGRQLVGDKTFAGSKELIEGKLLLTDYLYAKYDLSAMYCHIVDENKKTISFNKKWGYRKHLCDIRFPKDLYVNGMRQTEYIRTKEEYMAARDKIIKLLNAISNISD